MKFNIINVMEISARLLVLAAAAFVFACGGDAEPAPAQTEKVKQMLMSGSGTWTPSASGGITVDGVDVTDDLFREFSITFHDGTFSTTGNSPVWLRQDTWAFKDDAAKVIIRGQDQREITITEISATQLKLTLEWPNTTNGGRTGSMKGKHEFILNK